ncbi:energy transducer TonB [Altererythrobacter sp. ZODW24]|uniref:energy transducer TonB family protein n=1 Tax=Altererythrobacter sp. ZODW24 TaxID=2185142 RepID=UPI000DF750A7|nr:energy transducer TonB [Altererythrobacter sp. ZODW24]
MGIYRKFRALALTAAAAVSVAAVPVWAESSAEPLVLEPNSEWEVAFTGDRCVLARTFGSGADEVSLKFVQREPGHKFGAQLYGAPLALATKPETLTYQWTPDTHLRSSHSARSGTIRETIPALLFSGTFAEAIEAEDADDLPKTVILKPGESRGPVPTDMPPVFGEPRKTEISATTIAGALARPLTLKLETTKSAFAELKDCQSKMVAAWGLDASALGNVAQRAKPKNPSMWVTSRDIPKVILQRRITQKTVVKFRLSISANGTVDRCTTIEESPEALLNELTCELVAKRARFEPALDKDGEPAADFYISSVRWQTPR